MWDRVFEVLLSHCGPAVGHSLRPSLPTGQATKSVSSFSPNPSPDLLVFCQLTTCCRRATRFGVTNLPISLRKYRLHRQSL